MRADQDLSATERALGLLDVEHWSSWTAPLFNPTPWLHHEDYDRLGAVQAWLASRSGDAPSLLSAARTNAQRVLDDLVWLFDYDVQVRECSYWVRKWYHRGLGGTGDLREVEYFERHVLLIHNLATELARAVNLLLTRGREAEPGFLAEIGLVTVDTGSFDAPFQPAGYTDAQASEPEPYPGLRAFPAAIKGRDLGALGEYEAEPRTPEMFAHWVDELTERKHGALPSNPPREYAADLRLSSGTSRSSGPDVGCAEEPEAVDHSPTNDPTGWRRVWPYLREHNIWSKVVAGILVALVVGVVTFLMTNASDAPSKKNGAGDSSQNGDCRLDGVQNSGTLICGSAADTPAAAEPIVRTVVLPDIGDHWILPNSSIADAPPTSPDCTPAETQARITYFEGHDGVPVGKQVVKVEIVNDTDETLIIDSLEIETIERLPAANGREVVVCHDIGGDIGSQYVALDLTSQPPTFEFYDEDYRPTKPFRFAPEPHEPVVLYLQASLGGAQQRERVRWTARLKYSVGGKPKSAVIDDHGRPFDVTAYD